MRRRPQFLHHIILPEGFYTCSQSPDATDEYARTRKKSVKRVGVSLTVGVSVVTLGRGVSGVSNSNPDHSLWISYLLQSYKEGEKREKHI